MGSEGWQVLRPQAWREKLMGHFGEGDRAGWTGLPPRLPWNAMFIYGSLFLWGNFCQGWGSWQHIFKENSLLLLPLLPSPSPLELLGTRPKAAGDTLGEEEVSPQVVWGHRSGQPGLTPAPPPFPSSEPGKGVGT